MRAQLAIDVESFLTVAHRVECDGLLQQCLPTSCCLKVEHRGSFIKDDQCTTKVALAQQHLACNGEHSTWSHKQETHQQEAEQQG